MLGALVPEVLLSLGKAVKHLPHSGSCLAFAGPISSRSPLPPLQVADYRRDIDGPHFATLSWRHVKLGNEQLEQRLFDVPFQREGIGEEGDNLPWLR